MAQPCGTRIVSNMKTKSVAAFLTTVAATLAASGVFAQQKTYTEYKFIFYGMAYQTNGTGNIVGTPITDQTLLADRATEGGITDLSTVALAYHIGGDPKG